MSVIKAENISYNYPNQPRQILHDVSFEINKGDFVGIVGANGSGKSTLLKLILGIFKPTSGEFSVFDSKVENVRAKIGYLSQYSDIDFFFPITIQNIVLSGLSRNGLINKFSIDDQIKVEEILKRLDLWELRDSRLNDMSGGQKQKVFLARALISNPELLILDEPLNNLDIKTQSGFYQNLVELNKEMTIIVVDHNLEMLSHYVNKIICVDNCNPESVGIHSDNLDKLIMTHHHHD